MNDDPRCDRCKKLFDQAKESDNLCLRCYTELEIERRLSPKTNIVAGVRRVGYPITPGQQRRTNEDRRTHRPEPSMPRFKFLEKD